MILDNIIKLFESIGITMVIDENNRIAFYDSETKEKMQSFCTMSPVPFLSKSDIDYDVTLDKLMKGGRVKTASKNIALGFCIKSPVIDRQRTNDVIISEMEYAKADNGVVTNSCSVKFDEGRDPSVSISTVSIDKNMYETKMFASGVVQLERNGNIGYFNETFDEGYGLNREDMTEVLNGTYLLSDISDYYSPLFPNMKNSINKAKQSKSL